MCLSFLWDTAQESKFIIRTLHFKPKPFAGSAGGPKIIDMNEYQTYEEFVQVKDYCALYSANHSCPKCKKPVNCAFLDDVTDYNMLKNIAIKFECSCHFKDGSPCKIAWAKELRTSILDAKQDFINKLYWMAGIVAAMNLMPWNPDHMEKKYLERL